MVEDDRVVRDRTMSARVGRDVAKVGAGRTKKGEGTDGRGVMSECSCVAGGTGLGERVANGSRETRVVSRRVAARQGRERSVPGAMSVETP